MARPKMWVISKEAFPRKKSTEEKLKFILRYGILAPNPHNSQPWLFEIKKNKIIIHPQFQKRLKSTDDKSREIWISIGALIENLIIAGQNFGFSVKEKIQGKKIIVTFNKGKTKKNKLFDFITKRVTNKRKAKRILFETKNINKLKKMKFEKDTDAFLLDDNKDLEKVINLIDEANDILYSSERHKKEIISWMRFNNYQIKKTKDGIPYKTMGIPKVSTKIGRIFMKFFLSPKFIKKGDEQKIKNSSGIIIITSKRDCFRCWLNTGKTMQKILLEITSFKMQYSFLNQPCQAKRTRKKLKKITKDWPQIIIRTGYARTAPHTRRKPLEEVLITEKKK